MSTLLLGDLTPSHTTGVTNSFIIFSKFVAVTTGRMTEFQVTARASGNIKGGLYSDSSGPNTLLGTFASSAVSAGNVTIAFPSTQITSGVPYWLAYNEDADSLININGANGTSKITNSSIVYTDPFPNPGTSAPTTNETWSTALAGYGFVTTSGLFSKLW